MESCVFISLLTTGNTFPDGYNAIIQLSESFFKVDNGNFTNIQQKIFNVEPDENILANVYTYADVSNCMENQLQSQTALNIFYQVLNKAYTTNSFVIGWNIRELIDIINQNYKRLHGKDIEFKDQLKLIDIKKLTSLIYSLDVVGSYSLQAIYYYCYPEEYQTFRQDYYDNTCEETIKACLKFLKNDRLNTFRTLEYLYNYINEPHILDRMPFGKYKNYSFEYILQNDMNYLHWLIKQSNLAETDKDLHFTLNHLLSEH